MLKNISLYKQLKTYKTLIIISKKYFSSNFKKTNQIKNNESIT